MFHKEGNFVDLCLKGEALADEIDDYVDLWHESDTTLPLHKFLGLTREEYGLWVEQPHLLKFVLNARKRNRPLEDLRTGSAEYRLAARSIAPEDVEPLIEWLKHTGRVSD